MNTYFALLAEFETAQIPLAQCCGKFGLTAAEASRRAARQALPVPAFRCGSQKAPWLVDAADLARYLDQAREQAAADWARINGRAA